MVTININHTFNFELTDLIFVDIKNHKKDNMYAELIKFNQDYSLNNNVPLDYYKHNDKVNRIIEYNCVDTDGS